MENDLNESGLVAAVKKIAPSLEELIEWSHKRIARAAITAYLAATGGETREPSEEAIEAAIVAHGRVGGYEWDDSILRAALRAAYKIDFPAASKAPSTEALRDALEAAYDELTEPILRGEEWKSLIARIENALKVQP